MLELLLKASLLAGIYNASWKSLFSKVFTLMFLSMKDKYKLFNVKMAKLTAANLWVALNDGS